MGIEKYVTEIVTGVLVAMALLLIYATFRFSTKRAEAKAKGNEADAIFCETAERLCMISGIAFFIVALVNLLHSSDIYGITLIIRKLEEISHG